MIAAIVAAVMLVLTLASAAGAECVWVLWTETESSRAKEGPKWELDRNVHEKRDACESALEQAAASVVKFFGGAGAQIATRLPVEHDFFIRLGDRMVTVGKKKDDGTPDWYLVYKYACLPDTVDPRGAKASGR